MKQLTAILLLLVYTCTGNVLEQLQKAPLLGEHFREHQALEKDITVLEFLVIHYFSGKVKDADYERDMQLPFKTTDFLATASAQVFMPAYFPDLKFARPQLPPTFTVVENDSSLPSQFLFTIWQPPKYC
ncbi:hypothetical protein ACSX1A_09855 [Pontibacter sp. MBLB2868]|uniref:hypothetical protein n=1 Tax=Pontibacter sp. MBLB2868 TaxID=3451555 RepID=UPI003F753EC2